MERMTNTENWVCDEDEDGYDAVVIGSGYGGSVAACRMSMAGIKVCLIEKGRKWEGKDFPTNSFNIMSNTRINNRNLGVSLGYKDALFQVYVQEDSLVAVACGLGGGSLVNAGVMVPTPVRVRRDPKWPKEWETSWEACEASASAMLRVQNIPFEFPCAKVMNEIIKEEIEECFPSSINLSVNFGPEEALPNSMGSKQMGDCLACGNCLSGCPYNAKNSTDKTYVASAVQAGCNVKTEWQVQFVIKETETNTKGKDAIGRKQRRRWRVYINDFEYVATDFVILSAGVLGTAEILFQSQKRGLRLSERLGFGFSCNGNNVAYVAGSSAPLSSYGLDRKQLSKIPFQDRPGPSISSSYTSSLGFTIQSAVLPTAYPYLIFKGMSTYGWPRGCWFFHGIIDKLKKMVGMKASQAIILNSMGYDGGDGMITLEKETDNICINPPHDLLLVRKVQAFQKLAKKLGGILFMSRYRSTSVHLLGGCNAASDPLNGVCNPSGQVFDPKYPLKVHPGLYVCDASLIPCSVGINPCLTIATAAEYVSRHLVQDVHKYKSSTQLVQDPVMELLPHVKRQDIKLVDKAFESKHEMSIDGKLDTMSSSTVIVTETMRGHMGGMPCTAFLRMKMHLRDKKELNGKRMVVGEPHQLLRGRIGGYVIFKAVEKDKLYIIDGEVDLCRVDDRTPYTQYMYYHLLLASASGSRYILEGKKIMNPYLLMSCAWNETTTLHVTLKRTSQNSSTDEEVNFRGQLDLTMIELLRSLISLKGNKRGRFVCLLLQTLLRTYILQIPQGRHVDFSPSEFKQRPYPSSTLHEIKTDDGLIIRCRQWKCGQNQLSCQGDVQPNPVLLLNGYSLESYWLPTEPKDLVRALLAEGHETWLLEPRMHPLHPSNNFTIEDIGKFDIPAAINKICELHGSSVKVHVVAHCVGGLAIHIALMGGHVSATHISSLSCTNSSMFFKLTTSSLLKMRLPLIPISMVLLGKNKILPMFESSHISPQHRILKSIARLIPRYERCTCDECDVLSGIFGNAFWHENISPTTHDWLNKESLQCLPMSAFPHLRKICNAGFIVDANGQNSYLIHPERMSLPTLYISGGRTLLVTPRTSFLANQYMKLHQPGYRHERVVIEGFGHSDLLIGEDSYKRVFPHIISHIRLAQQENINVMGVKEGKYSKEALSWSEDPSETVYVGFGSRVSPSVLFWSLLLVCVILVSLFL